MANKVDSTVKLYASSSAPSTGGSNGLSALTFDANERLDAKKILPRVPHGTLLG